MICELPDYITDALDEFVSHYGSLEEVYEHKDDILSFVLMTERGKERLQSPPFDKRKEVKM